MVNTYTDYVDSDNGAQSIERIGGEVTLEEIYIDFSEFNVVATDIVQLFNVSKGDTLLSIITEPATAEGATATCDLGITTTDPNGLDDSVDLNATTIAVSAPGTDALIGYKLLADDTVDAVIDNDLDAAKVTFKLLKATANTSPASDSV